MLLIIIMIFTFKLLHTSVRFLRIQPLAENPSRHTMVFTTIRHATILHKLQHKLSVVRDVWNNVQETIVATCEEQTEKA